MTRRSELGYIESAFDSIDESIWRGKQMAFQKEQADQQAQQFAMGLAERAKQHSAEMALQRQAEDDKWVASTGLPVLISAAKTANVTPWQLLRDPDRGKKTGLGNEFFNRMERSGVIGSKMTVKELEDYTKAITGDLGDEKPGLLGKLLTEGLGLTGRTGVTGLNIQSAGSLAGHLIADPFARRFGNKMAEAISDMETYYGLGK